jgi:hypothetical protein
MNNWSCLPTAFAIVLGIDVADFIKHIGHDGSEIIWPTLKDPMRRRGFHVQECIDAASRGGCAVTPFEMFPRHAPAFTVPSYTIVYGGSEEAAMARFRRIVERTRGVITGHTNAAGHAVAYERGTIFDPRGPVYPYRLCEKYGFTPICAWSIT